VITEKIILDSDGGFSSFILTEQVRSFVHSSGVKEGFALVFFQHTTGAVMIVEHEAGFLVDLEDTLERLVPGKSGYKHHMVGYDLNGAMHVRNSLLNSSVQIPISGGDLLLGQYQDIMVLDMQRERSPRHLVFQVYGEA